MPEDIKVGDTCIVFTDEGDRMWKNDVGKCCTVLRMDIQPYMLHVKFCGDGHTNLAYKSKLHVIDRGQDE